MAMVPKLRVFASHWGTAPRFGNKFLELLDGLKAEGFAGIELSLGDLGPDAAARDAAVGAIGERGLRAIGRFAHLCRSMKVADIRCVATAAVRDRPNCRGRLAPALRSAGQPRVAPALAFGGGLFF